ncbi:MAG: Ig-like domain-containing protein, partial [Pseudomonadota bacterium]|nr:Ig-like domain-containing protein [Pseudomonadota bacterium]
MATNTNGGTTTSLNNTPQAKADTFYNTEDLIGIALLDVMLNDLGGNAKILWSVDDSATDAAGSTDLISTDIGKIESTATDTSAHGAKIWIQDGKVAYQSDTLSTAFKAQLQALAVGETITDTFTYAIRMSNGTLSWNTATIIFTGSNDGPVANADSNGADLVTEAGVNPGDTPHAGDPSASGNVLANDTDVDNGAMLTVKEVNGSTANVGSAITGTYGSVTINADGSWTYNLNNADSDTQALAQGDTVTETFNYTVTDEHGATSSSTLTITIAGANDGPVANADTGTTSENSIVTINVLANDSDDDNGAVLTVTAASAPAGQGTASVVGNQVRFDPGTDFDHLDDNETATVTIGYTIQDEHGATSTSTVEITVNGANDAPVSGGDDAASGSEDDALISGTVPAATDV